MGRDGDERRAIVVGQDLDPGGQAAVAVHLVDFGLDARHDLVGVVGAPHDDDRGDDVVLAIAPGDAEPRHIADIDPGHVLDPNRHAIDLGKDDILDVVDLVPLGQIVAAAVIDETDATNVYRL